MLVDPEYVDQLLTRLGQEAMRVYEMHTDLTRQDMIDNFGETGYHITFEVDLDAMRRFANLIGIGKDLKQTREVVTTLLLRGAGKAVNKRIPTTPRPPRRRSPQSYDVSGWTGDCPAKGISGAGHCGFWDPGGEFIDINVILPEIMRSH